MGEFDVWAWIVLIVGALIARAIYLSVQRRRTKRLLSELADRVANLENAVRPLVQRAWEAEQPARAGGEAEAQARPVAPAATAVPATVTGAIAQEPAITPTPEPPIAAAASLPSPVSAAPAPSAVVPRVPPEAPGRPSTPPPFAEQQPTPQPSVPTMRHRSQSVGRLEETLGTNWLNKLGIVILVLGVAFFLAYELRTLGPAGKILVGYMVSAILLGLGIFSERRERYRLMGRAGIGGGWALLFFTTYAMYHVQASRVMSSETADLILMLLVAAAMVAHTLRYHSQVVTGLAFLLGFLTVTISHVNVYSLSAGAILALGLVAIVLRLRWYEMEVFGILGAFLNHYLWLRPIIIARGQHHTEFPGYLASTLLLTFYWLIFRCSYVFRRTGPDANWAERVSGVAALLNAGLYILLMGYQSAHPELAFQFFVFVGAAEMLFGQLPITRRRRLAFILLTTLGATLLVAAFPYKYSGSKLSIFWLAEAEALFLAGIFLREIAFRRLALVASLVVAGQMLSVDAARLMGERIDGAHVVSEPRLGVIFAFAAAIFYLNALWLAQKRLILASTRYDEFGLRLVSYAGGVMMFTGAWVVFLDAWTAVAWSALALPLAIAGRRFRLNGLVIQANALTCAAVLRVLLVNVHSTTSFHHVTLRLISISIVALLIYLFSRWSGLIEFVRTQRLPAVYVWTASTLTSVLMWYELRPAAVALGWALFGLVLLELGVTRRSLSLRLQAYLALVSSFLRIFFVNLNAEGTAGHLSPRVYTMVPLALAYFYVYARLGSGQMMNDESFAFDRRLKAAEAHCFMGTISIAALVRFQMPLDWVAAAWAALTLVLVLLAWATGRRLFLDQAYVMGLAVLFRAILHNFYERSYFPAPWAQRPWLCGGLSAALLFAALPFALRLKTQAEPGSGRIGRAWATLHRYPEQFFFFVPFVVLTVLIGVEVRRGLLTVAWGAEAVAVFLFALWMGQRSFRLAGMGLLLLCVAKILLMDVRAMHARDRYITFIALGSALLLVSFLYTRYRETLRQYL